MSKPSINESLESTEKIFNLCCHEIYFQNKSLNRQQIAVRATYNNMLEISKDALASIKKQRRICTATLLRSLMEYYIDLLFILEAPSNLEILGMNSKIQFKKFLNSMNDSDHEMFDEITKDLKFQQTRNELNNATRGEHEFNIIRRFDCVAPGDYYVRYRMLSQTAHPDITQSISPYMQQNTDDTLTFTTEAPMDTDITGIYISTFAEILITSVEQVHLFFSGSIPKTIQEEINIHKSTWKDSNASDDTKTNPGQ